MAVIGLDLGGTKLSGAIFTDNGKIYGHSAISLDGRIGKAVGDLITDLTRQLIKKASAENFIIQAIGCCVPGIVYQDTGIVWAPNIPGWENFPLKETLENCIDNKGIRICLDNDRACSILGEVWQGAAKGCMDAIFLAVGTGIGAGIIAGGQIIRGKSDISGAIGWLALDQPFNEKYIPAGCFEYHASGDGLVRVAKEYIINQKNYKGVLKRTDALTAHRVFEAYDQGDPIAIKVLEQAISYWGMATANLVSLFNPDRIIFGGGVFGPAIKFLDRIFDEARKWSQPISINQVKLVASALGNQAGLFGSARIALANLTS